MISVAIPALGLLIAIKLSISSICHKNCSVAMLPILFLESPKDNPQTHESNPQSPQSHNLVRTASPAQFSKLSNP